MQKEKGKRKKRNLADELGIKMRKAGIQEASSERRRKLLSGGRIARI
jgi:hypothetical protein